MRIYIGGPMFSEPDISYNRHLKALLIANGFDVYCPNDNKVINDKTRTDITSERIYTFDIDELLKCNVFLCRIALDCGTMWEAGFMDCLSKNVDSSFYYGCIGLVSDIRLNTIPDINKVGIDNQAMYIDQFIVGGLKLSLGVVSSEEALIVKLMQIKKDME
ncbi:MAG: nucleoside 2-deoxyribosyltransferase [Clostridia bacterium]|nr:nucleoside 2-deoxyribosyltransferase [Clostridia bacterium]